jgi:hypothetical protein
MKPRNGEYRYNFTLDGGGWSKPLTRRFTTGKRDGTHCLRGWVGIKACMDGCENTPQGFDPRTFRPVTSLYTATLHVYHLLIQSSGKYIYTHIPPTSINSLCTAYVSLFLCPVSCGLLNFITRFTSVFCSSVTSTSALNHLHLMTGRRFKCNF